MVVDDYLCVGCGICTTRCKFDAIHLEKVSDYKEKGYLNTLARVVGNAPKAIGNVIVEKKKIKK